MKKSDTTVGHQNGTGYSERHLNNLYSTTYSYKGGNFRPSSQKETTEYQHFKRRYNREGWNYCFMLRNYSCLCGLFDDCKMIQVIERVEKILVYLSENRNREIPLTEIADNLGMNRATCANILKTMKDLGFVEQNSYRKGYIMQKPIMPFKQKSSIRWECGRQGLAENPLKARITGRSCRTCGGG